VQVLPDDSTLLKSLEIMPLTLCPGPYLLSEV
jgi:hypothetical protein